MKYQTPPPIVCALAALLSVWVEVGATEQPTTITVQTGASGKQISHDLVGIFFEDLSYAADGGLYAELVQNRSFQYSAADRDGWNSLTAWDLVQRGGGQGSAVVDSAQPLHPNNPNYAVLGIAKGGGGVGLRNSGFDGIAVKSGEHYDVSLFARQLAYPPGPLTVRLETANGELLDEAKLPTLTGGWKQYTATLTPKETADDARLVVLAYHPGRIALDMISLFPQKTFQNRPNGLRADLAQVIADLKPKFVRFPGGCLVHGNGLDNIYHWKNTIGPVQQRKEQPNIWGYHQSVGLGYFEYFQFCEDIGAMPLPVVAAGVTCQNAGASVTHRYGEGQCGLPMDEMPAYVQEVLDLIEYANGPVTSEWGARRAAAGHPEPFHLKYLGVGNEDKITPAFEERFKIIYDALKTEHPEITVIGTVGPSPAGEDYTRGWEFADELRVPMVDEHCYESPRWLWENLNRYDSYDRSESKVYLGEWAAHDDGRRTTLRSAIAEAAYLTSLERNGDVVVLASYAPLLAKRGHTQWNPDLIYFSNTEIVPTINYYVQQLFSLNGGDIYLPATVKEPISASPPEEGQGDVVFLGTWNTQAEFDDVRVSNRSGVVVDDKFEAGAQHWQPDAGRWSVVGGTYRQTGSDEPAISRLSISTGETNYSLTLRARKTGGAEGFLIGFKALDSDNYDWWNLGGWGNTRDAVQKTVGGQRETVGESLPGRIEPNRWYDIRVEVTGPRIQCYLDGVLKHDFTDELVKPADFAFSSVRDSKSGELILKVVNGAATPKPVRIELADTGKLAPRASVTVLAGSDPMAVNDFSSPHTVMPRDSAMTVGSAFDYESPANSLTIIRIPDFDNK